MQRCPEARFLVTTRERLGIAGEYVCLVDPLGAPDGAELFVLRAKAADSRFAIASLKHSPIERLVLMLDGLPLAIELAAARASVFSLESIVERMTERFKLLASRSGRPERQSTLYRAIQWSWDLLSDREQAALAQLSVFEGGFSIPAAEAVIAFETGRDWPWVADVVQALVEKSLVRRVANDRFNMMLSIQEFANEQLTMNGAYHGSGSQAAVEAATRHAGYFASFNEMAARRYAKVELDNFVSACRQAAAQRSVATAATLVVVCWHALKLIGPFRALLDLADLVTPLLVDGSQEQAAVEWARGTAVQFMGEPVRAREILARSLRAAESANDRRIQALALCGMGECERARNAFAPAAELFERAVVIASGLSDAQLETYLLNSRAGAHQRRGDFDAAVVLYEQALQHAHEAQDLRWQGGILGNLANIDHERGHLKEAVGKYSAALALSMQAEDYRWAANTSCNLGLLYHELGESAKGRTQLDSALLQVRQLGNRDAEAVILCNLGIVADALNLSDESRSYFKACSELAFDLDDLALHATATGYLAVESARRGEHSDAERLLTNATLSLQGIESPSATALLAAQRAEASILAGAACGRELLRLAEEGVDQLGQQSSTEANAALTRARSAAVLRLGADSSS
jgi:tetratricopeptide (TPR) repeat protein